MAEKESKKRVKTIDIVYVGLFSALIAVCAWISVPLTIPVTLQTLGICLTAGLLGTKRGTISVVIYILLGAIGVPVFSGFKGGAGVLFGATGGYIIGFIFTAIIVGVVSSKTKKLWALVLAMIGGVLVCYAFGTAWFAVLYSVKGTPMAFGKILSLCVIPFLLPDAVKIIVASILTNRLKKFIK